MIQRNHDGDTFEPQAPVSTGQGDYRSDWPVRGGYEPHEPPDDGPPVARVWGWLLVGSVAVWAGVFILVYRWLIGGGT
jgi:hypothetical protein